MIIEVMKLSVKSITIKVDGMVCTSCENSINTSLRKIDGVIECSANFKNSSVEIKYDDEKCNYSNLCSTIEKAGYTVVKNKENSSSKESEFISILLIVAIAFIIIKLGQNSGAFDISSKLSSSVSYITLFIVGLFTSLHCVGMCGGIMMSQSITTIHSSKFSRVKPSLLYNLGRLISYTILGSVVGALGKVFSISISTQAFISIAAGIFMVIMGINMSGFKSLRKFSIKLPWSGCKSKNKNNSPFIVGLLNGFMPCGPLQTMQLYALASGSALTGALSMFFFSLGTIPLMLVFGLLANSLNGNNSKKLIKVSGIIVIVLGIVMANRGLTVLGINLSPSNVLNTKVDSSEITAESKATIADGKQTVKITANAGGYTPRVVYVQKGVPTELIINGEQITSCNNEIILPSLNKRVKLSSGETSVEFTPDGNDINYSCWMGMISGKIKVVDDLNSINTSQIENDLSQVPESSGSCCSVPNTQEDLQFYGTPLSEVPTDRLIKTTVINDNAQSLNISGSVEDFEPIIIVGKENLPMNLNFDLSKIQNPDGEYTIYDEGNYVTVDTVNISKGKGAVNLPPLSKGVYTIIKDDRLCAIIEIVDETENVDLEALRSKYF